MSQQIVNMKGGWGGEENLVETISDKKQELMSFLDASLSCTAIC